MYFDIMKMYKFINLLEMYFTTIPTLYVMSPDETVQTISINPLDKISNIDEAARIHRPLD